MMHPSEIRRMSDEAAKKAAEENQTPYVFYDENEVEGPGPFPFPSIGDYEPPNWERVGDDLMCDSSGFGSPGELALTANQLKAKIKELIGEHEEETIGFAITEVGQFQVYVGVFKKVD